MAKKQPQSYSDQLSDGIMIAKEAIAKWEHIKDVAGPEELQYQYHKGQRDVLDALAQFLEPYFQQTEYLVDNSKKKKEIKEIKAIESQPEPEPETPEPTPPQSMEPDNSGEYEPFEGYQ